MIVIVGSGMGVEWGLRLDGLLLRISYCFDGGFRDVYCII